jgi:hypothetical protein
MRTGTGIQYVVFLYKPLLAHFDTRENKAWLDCGCSICTYCLQNGHQLEIIALDLVFVSVSNGKEK